MSLGFHHAEHRRPRVHTLHTEQPASAISIPPMQDVVRSSVAYAERTCLTATQTLLIAGVVAAFVVIASNTWWLRFYIDCNYAKAIPAHSFPWMQTPSTDCP